MTDLPAPPIASDVDLRGYGFMPLYGHHLFGSEFNARASDAAWRAGVTLWWASWNQVPAGSLPSDDAALCRLADLGRDVKAWKKLRAEALHGFVLCSDGRLYHDYLCKLAVEAWDRRVRERERKAKYRASRERAGDGDRDGDRGGDKAGTETGHTQGRNSRQGQGEGQRQRQGEGPIPPLASLAPVARARARPADVPRETPAYREHWLTIQAKYPPKPLREDWIGAERGALRLVESGRATWADLLAGVDRYAAQCRVLGGRVMNPANFFTAADDPWSQAWPIPERQPRSVGGLAESAKRWGEDSPEVASAGG